MSPENKKKNTTRNINRMMMDILFYSTEIYISIINQIKCYVDHLKGVNLMIYLIWWNNEPV